MKVTIIFAVVLCSLSSAQAQQAASPTEQALSAKLGAEIGSGLQCSAALIEARAQIKALQDQIQKDSPKPAEPQAGPSKP